MSKKNNKSGVMISVIVPTYNRPEMLIETLKSILNQTYKDFEIVVVNDAGIDVKTKIKLFNKNHNIKYLTHKKNKGLAAARNTGIKAASGRYIAYLDDDDVYYPDHLETLVKFLENSQYKVSYTNAYRVHQVKQGGKYVIIKKDLPYSYDFDYDRILIENFIPILCVMHKKTCLNNVGLFDEDLTSHEDWDLLIRMSRKFKLAHIDKVTCEFSCRVDGTTMTSEKRFDFYKTLKNIYAKYREDSKDKPQVLEAQRDTLSEVLEACLERIRSVYSSRTWKVGRLVIAPWRSIKKLFKKNKSYTLR